MSSPFSFDYTIGDTEFTWDLKTLVDRLAGANGESIGGAVVAGGQIAGAAGEAAVDGTVNAVVGAVEAWLPRVVIILLALVLIAGAVAMLGAPNMGKLLKAAT